MERKESPMAENNTFNFDLDAPATPTLTLDPVVVKNNWQRAYAFTTPQAANKLNAWANEPGSAQKKGGIAPAIVCARAA